MNYPTELQIGERRHKVHYEIVKGRTSSVRFRAGEVVLRLSRFAKGRKRDEVVAGFLKWAEKKLDKVDGSVLRAPVYHDGGRVCTHNKNYEIELRFDVRKNTRVKLVDGHVIEISLPLAMSDDDVVKKVKDLAEKTVMKDQMEYLKSVLDEFNALYFQEDFDQYRFKRMKSRFGSCSSKRNINIAYRLLFAPREVFRYVCAHELAHLREFNHSKRFWALVKEAMPHYKEQEKWLRENGFLLG
jgi:predicted metal-dependent hydrolase